MVAETLLRAVVAGCVVVAVVVAVADVEAAMGMCRFHMDWH